MVHIRKADVRQPPRYWRTLSEYRNGEAFAERQAPEFTIPIDSLPPTQIDRRTVLSCLAASAALAGLSACTSLPEREIVPYVQQPEYLIPGKPRHYATAMQLGDRVIGLLAETHLGRPTKLEGNPNHPASLGATDIYAQAEILTLWDPYRAATVRRGKDSATWAAFEEEAGRIRSRMQSDGGRGFRLLTGAIRSPSTLATIGELLHQFPEARWHWHEATWRDAETDAGAAAHAQDARPVYRISAADVIVALDSDFLHGMPGSLAYAREFAGRRRPSAEGSMNRLYAAEPIPTVTGSCADHRLAARCDLIPIIAGALLAELSSDTSGSDAIRRLDAAARSWVRRAAADLKRSRGRSLVIPGEFQPASVHRLAEKMNQFLGNGANAVRWIDPNATAFSNREGTLRGLIDDMEAGRVETLLILETNPAYSAPEAARFIRAMAKPPLRLHAGLYETETSRLCHWNLPMAHFLESWGDLCAFDGTCSIVQPTIRPLKGQKPALEILATLLGSPLTTDGEIVRTHWQREAAAGRLEGTVDFETFWRRALRDGVIRKGIQGAERAASAPAQPSAAGGADEEIPTPPPIQTDNTLELVFRPDPTLFDGRYTNNGWLQELPNPITSLTWGNAALMCEGTAQRLGLVQSDAVEITLGGRSIQIPACIVPGHTENSIVLHIGNGRVKAGGERVGVDVNPLRVPGAEWNATGATVRKLGFQIPLAIRQQHQNMENRDLIRSWTLEEVLSKERTSKTELQPERFSLYPERPLRDAPQWGMSIDLSACIGCGACTIACQAENNISVVGAEEVRRGRIMHWIRLDTYFEGDPAAPGIHHQPVPCMQCENAPCEVVCPVGATAHSEEGLNQMVYNRCVGTRYCSNNCPYKVRRFNFFQYADYETGSLKGMRNPNVSVRSRGVMEKCTYCVQRIEAAKIRAKVSDQPLSDGQIVTACQQVCPTQAIMFGNIADPGSRVSRAKADTRNYTLLEELNARPRTSYLADIRNPAREPADSEDAKEGAA
ncbi:MAG: Fe-S-cluster-containing hydrogenase [Bryobacterales bacterium]|nr:Fe-S-cluster-containing hydrogenase [Bryobacterales bacterium]